VRDVVKGFNLLPDGFAHTYLLVESHLAKHYPLLDSGLRVLDFEPKDRSRSSFPAAWMLCCAVLLALCCASPPAAFAQDAGGVYTVKEGDTLYSIARAHDLSLTRLRRLNELEGSTIYPGQKLRVQARDSPPQPPTSEDASPEEVSPEEEPSPGPPAGGEDAEARTPFYGRHTAEAGATFYTIAARYGTPVDTLRALNEETGAFLKPGEAVRLPVSLGPPAHTVAAGETLYDLARRYGVSVKLFQRLNGLESKQIREGQRLRIPGREAPAPQPIGTRRPVRESGPVARYPASYEGRLMAGGARYDPARYTASHPTLPLGTVVLFTNPSNGRQAFAQVADRGPLDEQFVMDVSAAVHTRLGLGEGGTQAVAVRVMD
jgi:LysM repeat protein